MLLQCHNLFYWSITYGLHEWSLLKPHMWGDSIIQRVLRTLSWLCRLGGWEAEMQGCVSGGIQCRFRHWPDWPLRCRIPAASLLKCHAPSSVALAATSARRIGNKFIFRWYRVILLSCWIKNSYCGQENKARSLREPAFESPMSDVYSNVFVEN